MLFCSAFCFVAITRETGVKLVKFKRVINFKPKHSYRLCAIMQTLCVSSKFLTKLKEEKTIREMRKT